MSGQELLKIFFQIYHTQFSEILTSLLTESGYSKSDLYLYLIQQGFAIEKTSMYRYFNTAQGTGRIPDKSFLRHFAAFVGLSTRDEMALLNLWQIKRQRRAKR